MAGSVGKAVMEAIWADEELTRYGAKISNWGAGWCLQIEGYAEYLAYQEVQFSEWNDFKAMRNRIASIKWLRGE